VLNCFILSDYDSLRDVREKKTKKTTEYLILIKKNMKLTACMYIRVMIAYQFTSGTPYIPQKENKAYKFDHCTIAVIA
jgi:hypothetical protein